MRPTLASLGLFTAAMAGIAFIYVPMLTLFVFSFNSSDLMILPLSGFTFEWYEDLFQDRRLFQALNNSLLVGGASVAIATIAGTGAALVLHRATFPGKSLVQAIVILPIVIPGVMIGLSLLSMFVEIGIPRNLWTVVMGYMTFSTSVVILIVSASLRSIDPSLEEAARDLGASGPRIFFRVTLPLIFAAILGGAILSFTLTFDEYIIAFLNSGSQETMPLIVMGMMKYGISPKINALATVLYAVSFILISIAYLIVTRLALHGQAIAGGH